MIFRKWSGGVFALSIGFNIFITMFTFSCQRDVNAVKQNPNAWRAAVGTFKTLAGMRGIQYELTYLDAYFSNEQKHGRYYDLAAPANEADTHIWLSKHSAGLQLWAMRQGQFDRKPAPGQTPDQPSKAGFSLPK